MLPVFSQIMKVYGTLVIFYLTVISQFLHAIEVKITFVPSYFRTQFTLYCTTTTNALYVVAYIHVDTNAIDC